MKEKMAARRFVSVEDYEEEASLILGREALSYYSDGTVVGYTLRDNLQAFNK